MQLIEYFKMLIVDSHPWGAVPTTAVSSSDRLAQETHPRIKHRVASCAEVISI